MKREPFLIDGRNICVRPRREQDKEPLFRLRSNPEYQRFLGGRCDPTDVEIEFKFMPADFSKLCDQHPCNKDSLEYLTIALRDSDTFVGSAAMTNFPENEWKVNVFISEAYRGLHLTNEVYWLLMSAAFDQFAASEVQIEFHPEHEASLRLARFFYEINVGAVSNDKWRDGHLVFKLKRHEYLQVLDAVTKVRNLEKYKLYSAPSAAKLAAWAASLTFAQ